MIYKYMPKIPTTKEFPKIILELGVCSDPALVKNTVQAHKEGS